MRHKLNEENRVFIGRVARYAAALSAMFIGYGLVQPLLSLFTSGFVGSSYLMVGALISTIGLVKAAMGPVSGFLSDKYGRKRMSTVGAFSMAASLLVVTVARTSVHLTVAFVIFGLGQAFFFLALMTAIVEAAGPRRRAMALGIYEGVNGLSLLVGTYMSGVLTEALGMRLVFGLATGFSLLSAMVSLSRNTHTMELRSVVSKEYLVAMVGGFLFMYTHNIFTAVIPLYVTMTINLPQSFMPTLFVAMSGSTSVGSLISGPVSDRVGRRLPLAAGLVVASLSYALLLLFKTRAMLLVSTLALGLGSGFSHPVASAIVADISSEETRGKAFGFYRLARDMGTFAGPAVSGVVSTLLGVGALFTLNIILTLVAACMAFFLIDETLTRSPTS